MTQNVVITGASAGIGRATAQHFGSRGANVTLLARGEAGLQGAVRDVEEAGGRALAVPTDMADYGAVEAAAGRAEQRFGPIDLWINVAFVSVFAPFDEISPQEFRRVTEVAYLGFVHGTRVALDRMKPRNHGTIVQVGSTLGSRSIPLQSAYCGAKHAVNGFTESVRCELMHEHSEVRITLVQMPAVNTPQFTWVLSRLPRKPQPVAPIFQPELAARAIAFAADHPRRKQYWVGEVPPPRSSRRSSQRLCWTGTSPVPASNPSRPRNLRRRVRATSGSPSTEPVRATMERTAPSIRTRTRAASRCGRPSTHG